MKGLCLTSLPLYLMGIFNSWFSNTSYFKNPTEFEMSTKILMVQMNFWWSEKYLSRLDKICPAWTKFVRTGQNLSSLDKIRSGQNLSRADERGISLIFWGSGHLLMYILSSQLSWWHNYSQFKKIIFEELYLAWQWLKSSFIKDFFRPVLVC